MKFFNFFRSKKAAAIDVDEPFDAHAARTMADCAANDHLDTAAVARNEAKATLTEKAFDDANVSGTCLDTLWWPTKTEHSPRRQTGLQ